MMRSDKVNGGLLLAAVLHKGLWFGKAADMLKKSGPWPEAWETPSMPMARKC